MNLRHITRFTYTFTNFQGWRVAIRRQGTTLTRYFSDKQYGDPELAQAHAIRFRDMVLQELEQYPERATEILSKHRPRPKKLYPAGLKPTTFTTEDTTEELPTGPCSVRSNKVMHSFLKKVCRRLHLDTASVFKLSLYLFTLHYGQVSASAENVNNAQALHLRSTGVDAENSRRLYSLVEELESRALALGMPSFAEFSTGKSADYAFSLQEEAEEYSPNEQPEVPSPAEPETPPSMSTNTPQPTPEPGAQNIRPPRPSPPSHLSIPYNSATSLSSSISPLKAPLQLSSQAPAHGFTALPTLNPGTKLSQPSPSDVI